MEKVEICKHIGHYQQNAIGNFRAVLFLCSNQTSTKKVVFVGRSAHCLHMQRFAKLRKYKRHIQHSLQRKTMASFRFWRHINISTSEKNMKFVMVSWAQAGILVRQSVLAYWGISQTISHSWNQSHSSVVFHFHWSF